MVRLQILLDEQLDAALEREAAGRGASKSAIVRDALRALLGPDAGRDEALWEMVGADGDAEPASVDDVVYPR